MVNVDVLKKHSAAYKMNKETAVEYHRQLFTKHPEIAEAYGADGIDPDSLHHSQKFVMFGSAELQYFFQLPAAFGDDRKWRSALSNFKEQYGDVGVSLSEFNKTADALIAALEKVTGGATPEQKQGWTELINKAHADMKTWGWY